MLGLLAVWPDRLGAGSVGGAGWAALFYCHFLAVPLSLPLSRLSVLSLPSPGRRWLCCLAGWGIASAGGVWVSSALLLAVGAVLASLGAGAGRCPLLALRPLPLLGAGSGGGLVLLSPSPSLLGAGVPLLSSGAGLLCAGAGCWPWVG